MSLNHLENLARVLDTNSKKELEIQTQKLMSDYQNLLQSLKDIQDNERTQIAKNMQENKEKIELILMNFESEISSLKEQIAQMKTATSEMQKAINTITPQAIEKLIANETTVTYTLDEKMMWKFWGALALITILELAYFLK